MRNKNWLIAVVLIGLLLPAHPRAPFFAMEEKVKRLGAQPNPFIDPNGLRNFIEMNEKAYHAQIQREREAK